MADLIPRITIAICTRDRVAFLEKCLNSILPQLSQDDELLIIDNASSDATPVLAARFAQADSRIRVYREETLGLSAGRNAAHKLARTEFVLFLDDDAVVRPGWVDAYVDFIKCHQGERIGCVGGACVPNYEAAPPAWHNPKSDWYDLGEKEFRIPDGQRTPGGGNCAYNTAAVVAMGGFCNDLKRAEDTDMHYLMERAGYEIWWLPGAPIDHFMSRERLQFGRQAKAFFKEGRAFARVRLRQQASAGARESYRLGRLILTPPYVAWYLLCAAATLPSSNKKLAARALQRALRVAGMGWQMWLDLVAGKFRYH